MLSELLLQRDEGERGSRDWPELLDKVLQYSLPEFACLLPFYLLGLLGWSVTGNLLLLVMIAGVVRMKVRGASLLEDCLERRPDEWEQLRALRAWKARPARVLGLELGGLSNEAYCLAMTVPLYIEVPQTLMAAGLSRSTWTGSPARRWALSWRLLPGLGPLLARVALPDLLAALTLLDQLWCGYLLLDCLGLARRRTALARPACGAADASPASPAELPRLRGMFYTSLTNAADMANLGLLARCSAELRAAEEEIARRLRELAGAGLTAGPGVFDRGHRFKHRVALGTVPRLYLKVSILMDSWAGLVGRRAALLSLALAIGSGMLSVATVLPDWLRTVQHWRRQLEVSPEVWRAFATNLAAFVFTIGLTAVILVRLGGTCLCPSHLFNTSSGCVPVLPRA